VQAEGVVQTEKLREIEDLSALVEVR